MSGLKIKVKDNRKIFTSALKSASDRLLKEIGELAVGYAQDAVPIDTGALFSSIGYEVEDHTMTLSATEPYAAYVELGTRYQRSQPYLKPAVDNHMQEYRDIAESILQGEGVTGKKRIIRRGEISFQ